MQFGIDEEIELKIYRGRKKLKYFGEVKSCENCRKTQDKCTQGINCKMKVITGFQQFLVFKGKSRKSGEATAKAGCKKK